MATHKELLENLDHCVCANLRKAARVVTQAYDEVFRPLDLKATQIIILVRVAKAGSMTINVLAEKLSLDRTTLTRNLKPLQRGGYLRVDAGKDKRERVVVLTPKGQAVLVKAFPLWKKVQARLVKTVGAEDCLELFKKIDHLMGAFGGTS